MPDVLIITGAGPGLGASIARRFAREGWDVGLVGRDLADLDALVAGWTEVDTRIAVQAADVRDPVQLTKALDALAATLGSPSMVVANASRYVDAPPSTLAVDDLLDGVRVSIAGALVLMQWAVPFMRQSGGGTVVFTGSSAGLRASVASPALSVQKAGVRMLALAAAEELAPQGIHVATITIDGVLGTPGFAPDQIAETFWQVQQQPRAAWDSEVVHRGPA